MEQTSGGGDCLKGTVRMVNCVGARSGSQDTGHHHMDCRLSDKRRGGPQGDGRLVAGQDDFVESSEKTPPNERGNLPVRRSSPKMGQTPGWDLWSMQAQQGNGPQTSGCQTCARHHRTSPEQCVQTPSPSGHGRSQYLLPTSTGRHE
jgi:hypothetical protein